jgi:GNAT superfamily N-acetyltransferase
LVEVRAATLDDVNALGRVHAASWRVAYAHLGPGFLATVEETERADLWERVLNDTAEHGDVFVSTVDGAVTGFVNLRRSRDTTAPPTVGEVIALYVEPVAWTTGCGRALMDVALATLHGQGFTEATLWVLEDNARARRFYEIAGWKPDGATLTEEWRTAQVTEVRYRRPLP